MDFALIMLLLLIATGLIWTADRLFAAPVRERKARELSAAGKDEQAAKSYKEPLVVEYARAFFPVILIVFLLRSFLVEPFKIPSGSMLPSLIPGDYILVNKFSYGIRLPVANVKLFDVQKPKRGDVMVFRYPGDPSVNYIKRVIGLPGDHIVYTDKKLYINDDLVQQTAPEAFRFHDDNGRWVEVERRSEMLDGVEHAILLDSETAMLTIQPRMSGQHYDTVVPEGMYFVMGDNRDRSNDSRYWGFVPDANLVGKAFLIWYSWDKNGVENGFWDRILWDRVGMPIN